MGISIDIEKISSSPAAAFGDGGIFGGADIDADPFCFIIFREGDISSVRIKFFVQRDHQGIQIDTAEPRFLDGFVSLPTNDFILKKGKGTCKKYHKKTHADQKSANGMGMK